MSFEQYAGCENMVYLTGFESPLTAAEIDSIWRYEPEIGNFYWRIRPCNSVHEGDRAGETTNEGYVRINYNHRRYLAHWLVWTLVTGSWPTMLIDHRDNDGSNNRAGNLRAATTVTNSANRKRGNQCTNLRGARFRTDRSTWIAVLDQRYLGQFESEQAAHEAWKIAAAKHYGEFARFD